MDFNKTIAGCISHNCFFSSLEYFTALVKSPWTASTTNSWLSDKPLKSSYTVKCSKKNPDVDYSGRLMGYHINNSKVYVRTRCIKKKVSTAVF